MCSKIKEDLEFLTERNEKANLDFLDYKSRPLINSEEQPILKKEKVTEKSENAQIQNQNEGRKSFFI